MNKEQAEKILGLCNKFCVDNDNNKINEWSSGFFVKIIQGELNKVVQADTQKEIEIQKEIKSLKKESTSVEPISEIFDETQKKLIDIVKKKEDLSKKDKR